MKNNILFQNKFHLFYLIGFFLILTLPLLSIPPLFHPATWGKGIVFRIIFSIMLFVFTYQILFKKESDNFLITVKNLLKRKNKAFFGFSLLISLLGIFFLATVFSLDPHFSLWGSPFRGGGFINFAFLILFTISTFLILKKSEWGKIWDFCFIIGALVSIVGIFQKFQLFSNYFVSYTWRPVSTIGGPIFLALYLLILSFLALSFGFKAKGKKKLLYLFLTALFIFVIFLTATRAAFIGLFIGFLFFIFFYPVQKSIDKKHWKKITLLKILTGIILILGIFGTFFLNTQPQLSQYLANNKIFGPGFHRTWSAVQPLLDVQNISFRKIVSEGRYSGWEVAFQALKQKPILGYGPENFSIGFDKYYDPTLPGVAVSPGEGSSTGYWDKGHNFIFDIGVSAGIPALIIYFSLFIVLFWQLQILKKKNSDQAIIYHGIQATFLAYLTANFFSFDVFSTRLISFLLIGYSLSLIYENNILQENESKINQNHANSAWKYIFIFLTFFALIIFIWTYNIRPLQINKETNEAVFLVTKNQCQEAINKMEKTLNTDASYVDNYLRLQYIDIITPCIKKHPENKFKLSTRAIEILEECIELRPYYTRNWIYLGVYANHLIESDPDINSETKQKLTEKAYSSFEKAKELSPKRPEIFYCWAKTDLINEKFNEAEEKADHCLSFAPEDGNCWWAKALALSGLKKFDEASECMEIASERGYKIEAKNALNQLLKIYVKLAKDSNKLEHYETLAGLYEKLIKLDPENFQHHASLAYTYKTLGKYEKARKHALIVMELSPESKANVEAFLKTLPN